MDLKKMVIGIELGSTRIKAVMTDGDLKPFASGEHAWENRLINGVWTYTQEDIEKGLQACFADLKRDFRDKTGEELTEAGAIGVSAMMHGYLPLGADGSPVSEFRTWRNMMTEQAADELTDLFSFNIPQRWCIAHLYQAILNGEESTRTLDRLTTLAGYIHYRLTGEHCVGIGEASGIFPVDSSAMDYNAEMMRAFDGLAASHGFGKKLSDILPRVLPAGAAAGFLTEEGARFLDPEGNLRPGIPLAPCEGDAGTGMTATNSVRVRTGNVSAGTSDFAMIVTDRPLGVHREIDMVTTPDGLPVAMVHCNNCTSDINAWAGLFSEFAEAAGVKIGKGELFTMLFRKALEGDPDCGGLLSYNYYSGESVSDVPEGRPLFVRMPDSRFTLANFMRMHLLSALATLKIGLDILTGEEDVAIEKLYGHGGYFKTPEAGQRMLSAAVGAPVSVMETAGEGGPYGMALLCAYMLRKEEGESLPDFLDNKVFAGARTSTVTAGEEEIRGFADFLEKYRAALPVEKAAAELFGVSEA